jgi:hypothetical protein
MKTKHFIIIFCGACRIFFEFFAPIAAYFVFPFWVALFLSVMFITWMFLSIHLSRLYKVTCEPKNMEEQ